MSILNKVNKLAGQCVKCALCLPHCPTYQLTEDENESPRGRIALFQAISEEKLSLTSKVQQHLDQCLGCRACEAVCPAHVKYGELLTSGRAALRQQHPHRLRLSTRLLMMVLENRLLRQALHYLLWGLEISGLRRLAPQWGLNRLLPPVARPRSLLGYHPAISEERGNVMLFIGCTSAWCDQETLLASLFVLRKWGYNVLVPAEQTCCGAMALHEGYADQALHLAKQNELAFSKEHPIITVATGCSAVLGESAGLGLQVIDIIDFIHSQPMPSSLTLQPIEKHVLIHTPCSRRYVLKTPLIPQAVLSTIPGLTIETLPSPDCCGAAGIYMLEHPILANQLADKLLSTSSFERPPDVIATSNVGCALHLRRTLHEQDRTIDIQHPILLLARALGF